MSKDTRKYTIIVVHAARGFVARSCAVPIAEVTKLRTVLRKFHPDVEMTVGLCTDPQDGMPIRDILSEYRARVLDADERKRNYLKCYQDAVDRLGEIV